MVGRVVRLIAAPLAAALLAEMVWRTSSLDWALGFFFGAGASALVWVWDAPPTHIENWRRGAEGERRNARALRALERDGWYVRHDVFAEQGNRDHVVVGHGGVYLLDTKAFAGLVSVDGDVVVDRLDNARGSYRLDRLAPRLRAEAARLKTKLQATARRTWVQAVVVIWGSSRSALSTAIASCSSTAMNLSPGCKGVQRRSAKRGRRS